MTQFIDNFLRGWLAVKVGTKELGLKLVSGIVGHGIIRNVDSAVLSTIKDNSFITYGRRNGLHVCSEEDASLLSCIYNLNKDEDCDIFLGESDTLFGRFANGHISICVWNVEQKARLHSITKNYGINYGRGLTSPICRFPKNVFVERTLTIYEYPVSEKRYAVYEFNEETLFSQITPPECSCCGEHSWDYHMTREGKIICEDCFQNNYATCSHCSNIALKESGEYCRDGSFLCPSCKERKFILPYHRLYPKVKFYGNDRCNSMPVLGFELEVDDGGENDDTASAVVNIMNKNDCYAYCSHDGSLDCGFEIITQPATIQYHNSLKHVYNELCCMLKSAGYSSHDTMTCGLHVHFNRDYFEGNEECLKRLIYMTEKFWNELVVFARRPEKRMTRYAKKIAPMEITEYIHRANCSERHDWHYYSLNIANENTIEFRIFKGTLNVNTLLATLQLVNNMVVFAKYNTMKEINDMEFNELITTKSMKAYWKRRTAIPDTEE